MVRVMTEGIITRGSGCGGVTIPLDVSHANLSSDLAIVSIVTI